jgi:Tol biopolymer transport system component
VSLDQELRSLLQDTAERCEVTTPDVEALVTGGRSLRHRQRVGRTGAGALVVALLATGVGLMAWGGQSDDRPEGRVGTVGPSEPVSPSWLPVTPTAGPQQADHGVMPFFLDLATGERTAVPAGLAPDTIGMSGMGTYVNYDVSSDGRRVLVSTCHSYPCSGTDKVFAANVDGSDLRELRLPGALSGYHPMWSPDGTRIVYQARSGGTNRVGSLVVQDVESGRSNEVVHFPYELSWWVLFPSFSPDGRSIVFQLSHHGSPGSDVWSVPVTGGDPTLLLKNAAWPAYLPDGRHLAFVEPSDGTHRQRIRIADGHGDRRTVVAQGEIRWPTVSPNGARIAFGNGDSVRVVDVSTGRVVTVARGESAEWLDDHTLLVAPHP